MKNIALKFKTEGEIGDISPIESGLINSTFLVRTIGEHPDYILQKKNKSIFGDIPAMMNNIVRVSNHLHAKTVAQGGDPTREVLHVVETLDGKYYHLDDTGDYWTMMVYIPDTVVVASATSPEMAFKGGLGIGRFEMLLADMPGRLHATIPGFHDLAFRHRQWRDSLDADKGGRKVSVGKEIAEVEKRWPAMLEFWRLVADGTIPQRVTHNDTKLGNILFDKDYNVQCVIDLDTVMNNTVLADYGDAIRSFANTGAEDDSNLDNIDIDMDIFEAYTRGYLSQAASILNAAEKEWLHFAPMYITFEQTVRFLMDYIDGDVYYHIAYPEHNLVRARAQQRLLEQMEKNRGQMRRIIESAF